MTAQQLPEGWQMVKFGDIAKHISKRVEPSETDLDIYVGLEHLDPDSLKIKRYGVPSDVAGQKLLVKKGQIIFGKRRAYQRKVAVADWDCICSAHAMVLEANSERVVPEFLPFFMQSDAFMNRAVAVSEGSLSPTIKWKILAEQKFTIPAKSRQKKILSILNSAQRVNVSSEKAIRALERLEEVIAISWFSPLVNQYSYKPLAYFADKEGLQTGPFGSQLHAKEYSNDGIPILMPKDLGFGEIDSSRAAKVPEHVASRLIRHRLIEGDFIFGRRGDVGRFGYVDQGTQGALCGTGCLRFRPKNKELNGFFNALFRSEFARAWLKSNAVGMTMLNLNTKILGDLPVPILDEDKYKKIALIFSQLSVQREILSVNVSSNKSLMNALLNR
ncbi:restriction endonuclease subunit S [Ectopseudomonas mendocina]|uniref:restriction endonuclease subunit S n=1 Tax=Ectopseudomonas mendocina TaxID=300 RepID=UPI00035D5BEB|nr:restriction endonuclease subunit S [Pseudomonas mendocina]